MADDDLTALRNLLAPNAGTEYGTILPIARDAVGPAGQYLQGRGFNVTTPVRGAMPQTARDAIKGWIDAVTSTGTGSLTPEALASLTLGSLGTGMAMAPRGAFASGAARLARPEPGVFPQMAERYPETAPPVTAIDKKSGREYLAKDLSPEAIEFQKARAQAMKDMEREGYTPYFDPAKRYDADPSLYPPIEPTTGQRMVKPATQEKYDTHAQSPEATARLDEAFQRGMMQKSGAENWYMMGQLEHEYIKEYGKAEGARLFKERFADAMAATTGGADPTANFLMAHYGNYLKARGEGVPANTYDMPFPIGGRYAANNMRQFDRMIMQGEGVTPDNPKRYNFSGNFLGNRAGATIDEQMSGMFDPKMQMPPPGTYGHYEGAMAKRAEALGVDPRYYQEVAWAGRKDANTKGGYVATPMISEINASIERTARLTGLSPEEVVRRGLVRAEMPMYGVGGPAPAPVPMAQYDNMLMRPPGGAMASQMEY